MPLARAAVRRAQAMKQAENGQARGTGILRSTEAPWKGLNTRDTFDNLGPDEARVLTNWFPGPGGLSIRLGYSEFATGIGSGDVKTLAELNSGATRKFIAFSSTEAFDITAGGAGVSLKSGLTASGRWDDDQMEGVIAFTDGVNTSQKYDGTTWSDNTLSGDIGANLPIGIKVHKNKAYYWLDDSQDVYYTADKAIGGATTKFRLGAVVHVGGKLLGMESWSVDGGDGKDDLAVFIFSSGSIVVYAGLNPGDASWDLVGVFKFGIPMSRDSAVDLGGDLLIQTREDYVQLTPAALRTGQERRPLSKMSGALTEAARLWSANDGWQAQSFPNGNMLIFNIPVSTDRFDQHILNTSIGAWTVFRNVPARVWGESDGKIYFGDGAGRVMRFWDTNADDGSAIEHEAETAWDSLKTPFLKEFHGVRPVITATGDISFGVGMAFDFGTIFTEQTVSQQTAGSAWDTSDWDTTDWAPEVTPKRDFFGAEGIGVTSSLRLSGTVLNQEVRWYRTDYLFTRAGAV